MKTFHDILKRTDTPKNKISEKKTAKKRGCGIKYRKMGVKGSQYHSREKLMWWLLELSKRARKYDRNVK